MDEQRQQEHEERGQRPAAEATDGLSDTDLEATAGGLGPYDPRPAPSGLLGVAFDPNYLR